MKSQSDIDQTRFVLKKVKVAVAKQNLVLEESRRTLAKQDLVHEKVKITLTKQDLFRIIFYESPMRS
jgi:hypothetical protein